MVPKVSRPTVVITVLAVALIAIGVEARLGTPEGRPPPATPVRTADLVMQDHDDGTITVTQAGTGRVIDTVPRNTNGFLRVVLTGLVRERRREETGTPGTSFHLTRWSDGRLTIDDTATGKLIELEAFGHTNEDAFGRLLDLTPPLPEAVTRPG